MKILVTGGQKYPDNYRIWRVLSQYKYSIDALIEGGAYGADFHARMWYYFVLAKRFPEIPIYTEFAGWDIHGKAAGPIRNSEMLKKYKPDLVIAFPGGTGTMDMVNKSLKEIIPVRRVDLEKDKTEIYQVGGKMFNTPADAFTEAERLKLDYNERMIMTRSVRETYGR